ncbi:hypothetical protein Tco_1362733 [Tanacetum coccineum]
MGIFATLAYPIKLSSFVTRKKKLNYKRVGDRYGWRALIMDDYDEDLKSLTINTPHECCCCGCCVSIAALVCCGDVGVWGGTEVRIVRGIENGKSEKTRAIDEWRKSGPPVRRRASRVGA